MKSIVIVSRGKQTELMSIGREVAKLIGAKAVGIDEIDIFGLAKYDLICLGVAVDWRGVDSKVSELVMNMSCNFNKKVTLFWQGSSWKKYYLQSLVKKMVKKQVSLIGSWQFKLNQHKEVSSYARMILIRQ